MTEGQRWHSRLAAACAAVLWAFVVAFSLSVSGAAQSTPAPSLSLPDTISVPASSQTPLRIGVGPATGIPRNAFVRIRGLPPMAALSEGHTIAPGAWAIALAALPNLRLTVPNAPASRSTISVTLVSVEGAILAEAQATLVVGPAQPPGVSANATILRAAPSEPIAALVPETKAPIALKPEDRDRAMRLVKRGQQLLEDSNFAEARLLFEKATDLGLAEAALALASTFDEAELARLGVRGVQADAKQARRWYERAAQLGAKEAQQRLQRLGAK